MGDLLGILFIILSCMTKFFFGLVGLMGTDLGFVPSIIVSNTLGMIGTFAFASFSQQLIKLFNPKRKKNPNKIKINKRMRRIVKIRNAHGLAGVAFLTPILLTIPVGTFVAMTIEKSKKRIFVHMLVSFLFWSVLILGVYHLSGIRLDELYKNLWQ